MLNQINFAACTSNPPGVQNPCLTAKFLSRGMVNRYRSVNFLLQFFSPIHRTCAVRRGFTTPDWVIPDALRENGNFITCGEF